MGLTTMQWRQPAQRSGNLHGTDNGDRPHDEAMEDAWIADARAAVVKKAMLGCEIVDEELAIAGLTRAEVKHEAGLLLERTETQRKRLTEPPEPAEPVTEPQPWTLPSEPEPEQSPPAGILPSTPHQPASKRRWKRDKTKTISRQAIEYRNEERELFND